MKYNLCFNYLRNIAYVFNFTKEKNKIYDLYFKYLPVYEIFIHSLKGVESNRRTGRIKSAHFLHDFVNVLNIKDRKTVDGIMLEILKEYTPNKNLRKIFEKNNLDIINNTRTIIKYLERENDEINKKIKKDYKLLPRRIKKVDNKNMESNLFNEVVANKNLSTELIQKGTLIDDIKIDIAKLELLSNAQLNLENFMHEININKKSNVEPSCYEVLNSHFLSQIVQFYVLEITSNNKLFLNQNEKEINNLYKTYTLDLIYDILHFINNNNLEKNMDQVKIFNLNSYSILESEMNFAGNIDVEVLNYGTIIEDDEINNIIVEVDKYHNNYFENEKISINYNKTLLIESDSNNINFYKNNNIDGAKKEILFDLIKNVDSYNLNIDNININILESPKNEVKNNALIDVYVSGLEVFSEKYLQYIDSKYDIIDYSNINIEKNKIHGTIIEDNKVSKVREFNKNELINMEIGNSNINIKGTKNINNSNIEVKIDTISNVDAFNLEANIVRPLDVSDFIIEILEHKDYFDENIVKEFNNFDPDNLSNHYSEVIINDKKLFDTNNLQFDSINPDFINMYGNNIDKYYTIFAEKLYKSFDDFTNEDLKNVPNQIIVKNIDSIEKLIKDLDECNDNNLNNIYNEILVNKLKFTDTIIKQFDDFNDNSLNGSLNEILIEKSNYITSNDKQFDNRNNYFINFYNNEIKSNFKTIVEKNIKDFNDFDIDYSNYFNTEIFVNNIKLMAPNNKNLYVYINDNASGMPTNILIENDFKVEKLSITFDEFNNVSTDGNLYDILLESNKYIENDNKIYTEYTNSYNNINYSNINNLNIYSVENTNKDFSDFNKSDINNNFIVVDLNKNKRVEKNNFLFNLFDNNTLNINTNFQLKFKENNVEVSNKLFDSFKDNSLSKNTISKIKFKEYNLEISDKLFDDFSNISVNKNNINILENRNKQAENFNKQFDGFNTSDIKLDYKEVSSDYNYTVEKGVGKFQENLICNVNLIKNEIKTHKLGQNEKVTNEFDDYKNNSFSEEKILVNVINQENVEQDNKLFDNYILNFSKYNSNSINILNERYIEYIKNEFSFYDDSNTDYGNSEIIVEKLPYMNELINKLLDNFDADNVNYTNLSASKRKQRLVIRREKEFTYEDIEEILINDKDIIIHDNKLLDKKLKMFDNFDLEMKKILSHDIINNNTNLVSTISRILDDYDYAEINTGNYDIDKLLNKDVEKTLKVMDEYDLDYFSTNNFLIDKKDLFIVEKSNKLFETINFDALNYKSLEINNINAYNLLEKYDLLFDDYNINNIILDNKEISFIDLELLDTSFKLFDLEENSNISKDTLEIFITVDGKVENQNSKFDNYKIDFINLGYLDSNSMQLKNIENIKNQFNELNSDLIDKYGIDINNFIVLEIEKLNKSLDDIKNDSLSNDKIEVDTSSLKNIENTNKELNDFNDKSDNIKGIDIELNSEDWIEKEKKEFDDYINDYDSLDKGIDIDNDKEFDGTENKRKEFDDYDNDYLSNSSLEVINKEQKSFEDLLMEVIKDNTIKSDNVEQVFYEIVTKNHNEYFVDNFDELLNNLSNKIFEIIESEVIINQHAKAHINNVDIYATKNKLVELFVYEIANKLINYKKYIEPKKEEILFDKIKTVNKKSYKIWKKVNNSILCNRKILNYTNKLCEEIETKNEISDMVDEILSLINKTKTEIFIKSLKQSQIDIKKDEIEELNPKFSNLAKTEVILGKRKDIGENIKDEITELNPDFINTGKVEINKFSNKKNLDIDKYHSEIEELIEDFVSSGKSEINISKTNKIEQDKYDDELTELNSQKLLNDKEIEIKVYNTKYNEDYINDELKDLDLLTLSSFGGLDVEIKKVKEYIENIIDDEIDELDPITHISREKMEALHNFNKRLELNVAKDISATNLNHVELNSREIKHKHVNPGVEIGQRNFNPKLLDTWSQDWIFLTERKTPYGELVEIRKTAIKDFRNFMQRINLYKDPIKGDELDEIVYKWSANTEYDIDYINEIEHFYYLVHNKVGKNNWYSKGQIEMITNIIIKNYEEFYVDGFEKDYFSLIDPNEEVRIRLRAMLHFYLFLEQLIDVNKGYLKICTVQEGIDFIKKILRQWIESETSYFEPTDEEFENLDPWIKKHLKENLPKDYEYLVRWFEWYSKEEEFIYGHNFKKDGLTAVSNIRDKMISYFNSHWGVRKTNYIDILNNLQHEVDIARNKLLDGTDPDGINLTIAMNKIKNFDKPNILIDTTVVDKIRGMMHGKLNRINHRFQINDLGAVQKSSLIGWRGINKNSKNGKNTWVNQGGNRYGNLKDSYNIDQNNLEYNKDYKIMIYNIIDIEKIEE